MVTLRNPGGIPAKAAALAIGAAFCMLMNACGACFSEVSEDIVYKGKLVSASGPIDTSLNIFFSSMHPPLFTSEGKIHHVYLSSHPNPDGSYFANTPEPSHCPDKAVHHWDAAPLRLYVTIVGKPVIDTTFTKEALRPLPKDGEGRWLLPDILIPAQ